ncbi:GFA family protein [Streptomyces huiliensis]|uniref:GFA family protein n=1 Tax=Streptomyces huiliensis TaxID=2876027 RepID=UPI001CC0CB90|nr:GFA family protein [Streptomyces huiliensis]MBZ4322541.1 GFA family protein [Streptomyces huiliensis]
MPADRDAADAAPEIERVRYEGSCHCGGVAFSATASRKLTITLCNCGICYKSGHQELMVPEERFELYRGQEFLKPYRFGNRIADHTFCAVCGVMPFYRPRSHPTGFFSVNARCLDLEAAEHIEFVDFDGRNWEASKAAGQHVLTE